MNLAEIQKAASEAYRAGFGQTWVTFGERHERGIAAVVASDARLMLAEPSACTDDDGHRMVKQAFANRLASLLKPADERVAVVAKMLREQSEQDEIPSYERDAAAILAALDALPKERA